MFVGSEGYEENTTISTPKVVPSAAMMNIEDDVTQLEVYCVAKTKTGKPK